MSRRERAVQLPLALLHPPDLSRDNFVRGASNAAALSLLERWPDWPAPAVVLSGPAGSGKTHLANIWAERAGAVILYADSLHGGAAIGLPASPLVIEDVDPRRVPERALFHLLNAAGEAGRSLLFTSTSAAQDWQVDLPDLRSRLRRAVPLALLSPDDPLLRAVLAKLFADRQIAVEPSIIDYLLARMERSLGFAVEIVAALDREALATGRQITRPLAAAILDRFAADERIHDSA